MWKRLAYLLLLVFFTKTIVKAGFVLPGFSTNPKNLETLKKDKAFYTFDKVKQACHVFSKRKIKARGIHTSLAELPVFYVFHFRACCNSGFSAQSQWPFLNSYQIPSRRGPPLR